MNQKPKDLKIHNYNPLFARRTILNPPTGLQKIIKYASLLVGFAIPIILGINYLFSNNSINNPTNLKNTAKVVNERVIEDSKITDPTVISQNLDQNTQKSNFLEYSPQSFSVSLDLEGYDKYKVKDRETLSRIIQKNYPIGKRPMVNDVVNFNLMYNKNPKTQSLSIDDRSIKGGLSANEPDGIMGDHISVDQIIYLPKRFTKDFTLENVLCDEKGFTRTKDGRTISILDYVQEYIKNHKDEFSGALREITIKDSKGVSLYDNIGDFIGSIIDTTLEQFINDPRYNFIKEDSTLNLFKQYFNSRGNFIARDIFDSLSKISSVYNSRGVNGLKQKGYKGDLYLLVELSRRAGNVVKGSRLIERTENLADMERISQIYLESNNIDSALQNIESELKYKMSKSTLYRVLNKYQMCLGQDSRIRKRNIA